MTITKTERHALERIWAKIGDSEWESFESFASWSLENKWCTGKTLYKLNEMKPHGPENSYWYLKNQEVPDSENALCLACSRKYCPGNNIGCKPWRDAWIKNWNENICIRKQETQQKREAFQYEHPDLVREGIVFEASR